jgi:hypothetical protein
MDPDSIHRPAVRRSRCCVSPFHPAKVTLVPCSGAASPRTRMTKEGRSPPAGPAPSASAPLSLIDAASTAMSWVRRSHLECLLFAWAQGSLPGPPALLFPRAPRCHRLAPRHPRDELPCPASESKTGELAATRDVRPAETQPTPCAKTALSAPSARPPVGRPRFAVRHAYRAPPPRPLGAARSLTASRVGQFLGRLSMPVS